MEPATVSPKPSEAPERVAYERSTHSRTLGEMFLRTTAEHDGVALSFPSDGGWVDVDYRQLGGIAREIARGLIALGVGPGDRVSILADTRPEWTYADAGAMCAGAVVAPIYHTNSPGECRYVLDHCGARAVFCENQEQLDKIAAIRDELPALDHVIAFEGSIEGSISVDDLRACGGGVDDAEVEDRVAAVKPDRPATFIYTSGTTGPPKGCILTHRNWISTMRMYEERLELRDGSRVFMFLPLAHSLARTVQMVVLDAGGTLAFWGRDPKTLLDDIEAARPTHFPSVPRVFEKIHTRATSGIAGQPAYKRALVRWALATGRRTRGIESGGGEPGRLASAAAALADRIVLAKVRGLFGPDLTMALVGAAPTPREVLDFFDSCGIRILEGWGMTETCAAGTLNTHDEYRAGTVGRPLPGVEVRIAADGEVLTRGPNVFAGYHHDEAATREALEDGWLHTGDLGAIDAGYLSITGRKKDIIVTSSGKNITPVNIENALKATRWISEAVVYGDNRSYLVALLTLDPDEAPKLAEQLAVSADPAAMARSEAVHAELAKMVDEVNRQFARIEQVKRFGILDRDLTQAAGELTPTMKVKRAVVYERYADEFAALYEDPADDGGSR